MLYRFRQMRLAIRLYRLGIRDWAGDALLDSLTGGITFWYGETSA